MNRNSSDGVNQNNLSNAIEIMREQEKSPRKKVEELNEIKKKMSLQDDLINNMSISELRELQSKVEELRERLMKRQGAPFGLP